MGILLGLSPLGSGPTCPGSGFSVIPICMGSCFPGSESLLCSPVVCKYSLKYLVYAKFFYCLKKDANSVVDG